MNTEQSNQAPNQTLTPQEEMLLALNAQVANLTQQLAALVPRVSTAQPAINNSVPAPRLNIPVVNTPSPFSGDKKHASVFLGKVELIIV